MSHRILRALDNDADLNPDDGSGFGLDDLLTCRWLNCSESFSAPEALYDHLCENHVGRKSNNNLCLTCQWAGCNISTVKRDHITSHLRIHVPLKPHKCVMCEKSFKRPQDLKKHVKTHVEIHSSLSHEHEQQHSGGANAALRSRFSAVKAPDFAAQSFLGPLAQLHGFLPSTSAYLGSKPGSEFPLFFSPRPPIVSSSVDTSHVGRSGYASYQPQQHHHQHQQQQYQNQHQHRHIRQQQQQQQILAAADNEERRRTLGLLDDLLVAFKRKEIDPSSYADVNRVLTLLLDSTASAPIPLTQPTQSVTFPSEMSHPPASAAMLKNQLAQHLSHTLLPYEAPPSHGLRTKDDLTLVDQLLAQMQATIYENPAGANLASLAGTNVNTRSSEQPPEIRSPPTALASTVSMYSAGIASLLRRPSVGSAGNGTSDSPLSSTTSSYEYPSLSHVQADNTRGGSSQSSEGREERTPMYPQLFTAGHHNEHNVPLPSLGGGYGVLPQQRYSNSMLQCGRVVQTLSDTETSDAEHVADAAELDESDEGEELEDAVTERWLEEMRTVEGLRAYVKLRLKRGDYWQPSHQIHSGFRDACGQPPHPLYPRIVLPLN